MAIHKQQTYQSLWMLAAGLSFALMTQSIKIALNYVGVFEISLYRSIGGIILLYVVLKWQKKPIKYIHRAAHFWRGAWGFVAVTFFYIAIDGLEPSTAYAFNYLSPLLFLLLAAVVLGEKLTPISLFAVSLSFAGVLCLLRPDFDNAEFFAAAAGLASGVCAAMAFLMIRKLGIQGEGGTRTVYFFNIHTAIFTVIALLIIGDIKWLTIESLASVTSIVVLATTGQLALTRALHKGQSALVAALSYCGVIFSVGIDAGVRSVNFFVIDYLGFALIVLSGTWALWLSRKNRSMKAAEKTIEK